MKRLAWASLLLLCVSPVVYLQETNGQKEDIVFETDNTNAKPFDKIEFIVNINDMATNKKVCQVRKLHYRSNRNDWKYHTDGSRQ